MKVPSLNRRDFLRVTGISAAAIAAGGCASSDPSAGTKSQATPVVGTTSGPGTVPDTLDLSDRAELALHALTGALDYDRNEEIYFVAKFCRKPAVMIHTATGLPTNSPKFAEAQAMMRVMCGSDYNLEIQHRMMEAMLRNVHSDGLYYSPLERRPWASKGGLSTEGDPKPFANVYGNARFMLAMLAWQQWEKNSAWEGRMKHMADGLMRVAIDKGDYAYYPVGRGTGETFSYTPEGWGETEEPTDGEFGVPMYFSGVIRALSAWWELSGDRKALSTAGKLAIYAQRPFVWKTKAEIEGADGPSRARCAGHSHAHAAALRGLLAYAIAVEDEELMLFVRDGYEWLRSCGEGRIGWFPEIIEPGKHCESCAIGDMVPLAIRLSEIGMGDYWDDVDRYVRNQLIEQQLTNAQILHRISDQSPAEPVDRPRENDDHAIERNLGAFVGHGDFTILPETWIMHCCTGNGTTALYYAWESIMHMRGTTCTVNLLLNRRSPYLDLSSSLPYQGLVVAKNKQARNLLVRMPPRIDRKELACTVNGSRLDPLWAGPYVLFKDLRGGETVRIQFPVREHTEKLIYDPGKAYEARFKGTTVVDISPRQTGIGYPIYQRAHYRSDKTPLRPAPPYVAKEVLKWT